MRCEEVRTLLEEMSRVESWGPVGEHVTHCAECRAYAEDWDRLREGFRALAAESGPEPSTGFVTRLMRRLQESATQPGVLASEFLERIGRRVVLAGLLLALAFLMAVALPPSGPLRGPVTAETSMAKPEVAASEGAPIFGDPLGDPSAVQTVFAGEDDKGR